MPSLVVPSASYVTLLTPAAESSVPMASALQTRLPLLVPLLTALLLLLAVGKTVQAYPADAFVTTWQTTEPGETITIPTARGVDYDFTIDWGNGHVERVTGTHPQPSHRYPRPGTHTIAIRGNFPQIDLFALNSNDAQRLRSIEQWGAIAWQSMLFAFSGATNLVLNAADAPDLSGVSSLQGMFHNARNLDSDLNHWDVSGVTDMDRLFAGASRFNGNISGWDVSAVTDMSSMFEDAERFNGDLSRWNTSRVTSTRRMFREAKAFNGDLSRWDVSAVTDMEGMFFMAESFSSDLSRWNVANVTNMRTLFYFAPAFNSDLSRWDVSNVTNMESMFAGAAAFNSEIGGWDLASVEQIDAMFRDATSFNADISGWDVSRVTGMHTLFGGAHAFDQDLSGWDVSNVNDMASMFNGSGLSPAHYDRILVGWAQQPLQAGVTLGATRVAYCNGELIRNHIITEYNWTIHDEGRAAGCPDGSGPIALEAIRTAPSPGAPSQRARAGSEGAPFITTWRVTAEDRQLRIPTAPETRYDFTIDWGDGTVEQISGVDPNPTHTYTSAGTYTVTINGDFPRIYLNVTGHFDARRANAKKLLTIEQWGDIRWSSMEGAFAGAEKLTVRASDTPDLSRVTSTERMFRGARQFNADVSQWDISNVRNMRQMFSYASAFNGRNLARWDVSNVTNMSGLFDSATAFDWDISGWDVSNVTDMSAMFQFASRFNRDISGWNVSRVTSMEAMFHRATDFDQDLNRWDVSQVTNMDEMFRDAWHFAGNLADWNVAQVRQMRAMFAGARRFNSDLSRWNVSHVTDMERMFAGARVFSSDISGWNVSRVHDMSGMFIAAAAFNSDIGGWDVASVTNMRMMFADAERFDRDLSGWDVSRVRNDGGQFDNTMEEMFDNSGLSTRHYDRILQGWASLPLDRTAGVILGAKGTAYCDSAQARRQLIERFNWRIEDAGRGTRCP